MYQVQDIENSVVCLITIQVMLTGLGNIPDVRFSKVAHSDAGSRLCLAVVLNSTSASLLVCL
jgi:hypothetical protein